MLPKSFVYNELRNKTAVIMNGTIMEVKERRQNQDYFRWYTKTFGIEKGKNLKTLEEDYLETYQEEIKKLRDEEVNRTTRTTIGAEGLELVDFFIGNVVRDNGTKRAEESCKIEEILKGYHFICCNTLYEVKPLRGQNHEIFIEKRSYSIDRKTNSLEGVDEEYRRAIGQRKNTAKSSQVTRIAEQKKFYDRNQNLGFETTERGFYIYTTVEPYALYERKNRKYYGFGRAKIGVHTEIRDGKIIWHQAVVMNKYIHPALKEDGEYQSICTGNFSYNHLINRHHEEAKQIRAALEEARRMIERGYFSEKGSWNELTHEKYKTMELQNTKGWRVTNI